MTAYGCAGEACEVQLWEGNQQLDSKSVAFRHDQDDQQIRWFEVENRRSRTA
ncbi:MAG: hypothetical protein U0872_00755 [Planctomycetaceae bacterium]